MNDKFNSFAKLLEGLIAKYAGEVDLDALPDPPAYTGDAEKDAQDFNCYELIF